MSRGVSTDNPIILFGNIGPDVVKVSQIYDPDNDQYTLSQDVLVQEGKTYYTRSYANRTITFIAVASPESTANPMEQGWYEINETHVDQTGKYIPAVHSLVVCDKDYKNFKTRSVLIVTAVDDQGDNPTFRSTLVPAINGEDTEVSPRIVDYGNDRFMLYMEDEQVGDTVFTRLSPDRKLMLYGDRLYGYVLKKDGKSIAVPDKALVGTTNDAIIPYSGETTRALIIDHENIESYEGKLFSVLVGTNYRSTVIPPIKGDAAASVRCKTLDGTYKADKNYYLETYSTSGGISYVKLNSTGSNRDYNVGDPVGELASTSVHTNKSPGYARIYNDGTTFLTGAGSYSGWVTYTDSATPSIRWPERCYLRNGVSLANGEPITMEVCEYVGDSYRMIISLTIIARPGSTLNMDNKFTKQIDHLEVIVENADTDVDGKVLLPVGGTTDSWIFHLMLVFNDGSSEEVKVDDKQSFMYGLSNVNSSNAGQEFRLLFKYFPTQESSIIEHTMKNFVSTTLTIKVAPSSSINITKVSTIPMWKYGENSYKFGFLAYNQNGTEPQMVMEGESYIDGQVLAFNQAAYKDAYGNIKDLSADRLGSNMGLYEHGRLALTSKVEGHKTDVYRQKVALRLQSWEIASIPTKWLIGEYEVADDTEGTIEEYSADEVPYGSNTLGPRPFIECTKATKGYNFRIAKRYPGSSGETYLTKEEFLKYYFRAGYESPITLPGGITVQAPNRYRIRTTATVAVYDALNSEYALAGINYYKADGTKVAVVVGKTPVAKYYIHVQEGIRYFNYDAESGKYTEVVDLTVGATLTQSQRESLFVQRQSPVISDWKAIPDSFSDGNSRVDLKVAGEPIDGMNFYPTRILGGPIPTVVGEDDSVDDGDPKSLNTQVMGLAIVEFAYIDSNFSDYMWIYGVPVEVMFPFKPTQDLQYVSGTTYYIFNEENNWFVEDTGWTPGTTIPSKPQRYVSIY